MDINEVYKPAYNWGAPSCIWSLVLMICVYTIVYIWDIGKPHVFFCITGIDDTCVYCRATVKLHGL